MHNLQSLKCSLNVSGESLLFNFFSVLFFLFMFFLLFKYICLHFHPSTAPRPTHPASHPQSYPLWLCPCVLYICSLMDLPLFSSIIPSPLPSGYCQFVLYFNVFDYIFFACLFVLLIMFQLQVRSCGICLSLPILLHLA